MDVLNKEVLKYINDYYTNSSDPSEEFRLECEESHIPVIKRETQGFLSMILKLHSPKSILEIGTGAGYSSIFMAGICPDSSVTTLELIEKRYVEANINIEKFHKQSQITVIEGDASLTLNTLIEDQNQYDFVFIDSAKSRYKEFFEKSVNLMPKGGIIVADNILLDGRTASDSFITKHREKTSMVKMREFIVFLKNHGSIQTQFFAIGDGVTVSLIPAQR